MTRGKLIPDCPPLFLFILISCFAADQASAQTVPSPRETQDSLLAVSTISAGTWLTDLQENDRTATTTTERSYKLWRDVASLRSAFAKQSAEEKETVTQLAASSESGTEDWGEIIADMEKHDDIICLYRKETDAKIKKFADWQKLLKAMLPTYTVHLALENGHKYVICLKRISAPTSLAPQTLETAFTTAQESLETIPASTELTQSSETPAATSITQSLTSQRETTSESTLATESLILNETRKAHSNNSDSRVVENSKSEDVAKPTIPQDELSLEQSDERDCSEKSEEIERVGKSPLIVVIPVISVLKTSALSEGIGAAYSPGLMHGMPQTFWPMAKNPRYRLQTHRLPAASQNPVFYNQRVIKQSEMRRPSISSISGCRKDSFKARAARPPWSRSPMLLLPRLNCCVKKFGEFRGVSRHPALQSGLKNAGQFFNGKNFNRQPFAPGYPSLWASRSPRFYANSRLRTAYEQKTMLAGLREGPATSRPDSLRGPDTGSSEKYVQGKIRVEKTPRPSNYVQIMQAALFPKSLFAARQIPRAQSSAEGYLPAPCKDAIPLRIKIQDSTHQPIRVNVVPGTGENVTLIDAQKGLLRVERIRLNSLDGISDSKRNLARDLLPISVRDEAQSLEDRIDEIAARIESRVYSFEENNLPSSTANPENLDSTEDLEEALEELNEARKLNYALEAAGTMETTVEEEYTSAKL